MSSSYDRNIDRLRSAERSNAQTAMSQRTAMANTMGQRGIREAGQFQDSLNAFSKTLQSFKMFFKSSSLRPYILNLLDDENF